MMDQKTDRSQLTERRISFLKECVSSFHTVLACEKRLEEDGFARLEMSQAWHLDYEGKYYVRHRDSSLFAFTTGQNLEREIPVRIAAAHTDFPGLCIKPDPQLTGNGYIQLNVEVYGGPILSTWLDRPLSAAGRVAVRSADPLKPDVRIVDLKEPFLVIPNLAIHMNREINKGFELNRQKDLLPVAGLEQYINEEAGAGFLPWLAGKTGVSPEDILDFDLYLYDVQEPVFTGMNGEFLSASHLDNTTSVIALTEGITGPMEACGLNVAAFFDNEEIGSRTAQGAGSIQLRNLLEKILKSLPGGVTPDILYDSMLVSADVAHAVHPNHPEKADILLKPRPGEGFCIKEACSQSYATDSSAIAVLQQICDVNRIPWQKYVNRSDVPGGGTLGNIMSAYLPAAIVDIGIPILAMHSVRELMGWSDMDALSRCIHAFYRA